MEANSALESQIATLNAEIEANSERLSELDGGMNEQRRCSKRPTMAQKTRQICGWPRSALRQAASAALAAAARKEAKPRATPRPGG